LTTPGRKTKNRGEGLLQTSSCLRRGGCCISTTEGFSKEAATELAKLADLIADPVQRKAFDSDPDGTLDRSDVNPEAIPENVLNTLKGLSQQELRLVARLNSRLIESGLSVDVADGRRISCF
jgi:hypothetical protein